MCEKVKQSSPSCFVAGFLFDDSGRVVCVRKNKPSWQAGSLNAVGGKVEPGESPADAVRREFFEEAGLDLEGWEHLVDVEFFGGAVHFYRLFTNATTLDQVRTCTDEAIEVHDVKTLLSGSHSLVSNMVWVLPFAFYTQERYTQPVIKLAQ